MADTKIPTTLAMGQAVTGVSIESGSTLVFKNTSGGVIASISLPSGGASEYSFIFYSDMSEFPAVGSDKVLYIVTALGKESIYAWDTAELKYKVISNNYENVKVIDGGSANG